MGKKFISVMMKRGIIGLKIEDFLKSTVLPKRYNPLFYGIKIKETSVMKKKQLMITIAGIALVCAAVVTLLFAMGEKPYKSLDAIQIVSAKVLLTPPDKTVEIEEIPELVDYLNDVVIYNQNNSYTEYDGQAVTFTLTMTDGTQANITAFNPFLIIDGVGYKTKYEPCEALNSYANELVNSETAN